MPGTDYGKPGEQKADSVPGTFVFSSLIPLSVGGLGLREATMVVLFGAAGISTADVLSVSLTVHLINTVLSLWGGALMLAQPLKSMSSTQS